MGEAFIGRGGLFDLKRVQLSVAFQNHGVLSGVAVAVKTEVWFAAGVLVAFHDLRYGVILQQSAAHGADFGDLRRGPARQIAHKAGIVKIDLRRFDGSLERVVGIGMQKEDDPQRFQNAGSRFGGLDIDIRAPGKGVIIQKLRGAGGDRRDEPGEFQRVHASGYIPHVPFYTSGKIGGIEYVAVGIPSADDPRHGAQPQPLEKLRRSDGGELIFFR